MKEDVGQRQFADARERDGKREEGGTVLRYNFDGKSLSVSGRTLSPAAAKAWLEELQEILPVFAKLVPESSSPCHG